MKPGDLVRLKGGCLRTVTGVAVSWTPPPWGALEVIHFDTDTPALLLQTDEVEFPAPWRGRHSVAFILIEGRVGWVWSVYLEVV